MQSGTYGDQPVCDQVSALYPCDRRFISAASIAAGVVTSAAFCNSANSSRVTWAHALRMQPLSTPLTSKLRSYRRTTQPSSGPSGSRKSCFCGWPSFSAQPSLWRNVLRLAHSFRASNGTILDCRDAMTLSPAMPYAQAASASCRRHNLSRFGEGVVSRTLLAPTRIRVQRCNRRDEARVY